MSAGAGTGLLLDEPSRAGEGGLFPDDQRVAGQVLGEADHLDDGLAGSPGPLDGTDPRDLDLLREGTGLLRIRPRHGEHVAGDVVRGRPQGPLDEAIRDDVLRPEGPQLEDLSWLPRFHDLAREGG